jgi:hypothetical protein
MKWIYCRGGCVAASTLPYPSQRYNPKRYQSRCSELLLQRQRCLHRRDKVRIPPFVHFPSCLMQETRYSPTQLVNAGIPFVILGHSERRTLFHETSDLVAQKTVAALMTSLSVILCVGETLEERETGKTDQVVQEQLQAVVEVVKDGGWRYTYPFLTVLVSSNSTIQQNCCCVRTSVGNRDWQNSLFSPSLGSPCCYQSIP